MFLRNPLSNLDVLFVKLVELLPQLFDSGIGQLLQLHQAGPRALNGKD
jgi:hypothetical protein